MNLPPGLLDLLHQAQNIAVLTGAGISAESGIPTFRDSQTGLWARYHPEELATPEAFDRNPRLVWDWYALRRDVVRQANPNPGHFALAKLEEIVPNFSLITQNIDSLHQRAGSRQVIELHGNINRVKCAREEVIVENWEDLEGNPPRCPGCGGMLRPDVVWFGEALPTRPLHRAIEAAINCQVILSIGTSSTVEPAASLPFLALKHGARIIEINPSPTPLSQTAHFYLCGPSGIILPILLKGLLDLTD